MSRLSFKEEPHVWVTDAYEAPVLKAKANPNPNPTPNPTPNPNPNPNPTSNPEASPKSNKRQPNGKKHAAEIPDTAVEIPEESESQPPLRRRTSGVSLFLEKFLSTQRCPQDPPPPLEIPFKDTVLQEFAKSFKSHQPRNTNDLPGEESEANDEPVTINLLQPPVSTNGSTGDPSEEKRLFIENVPSNMNEQSLQEAFGELGVNFARFILPYAYTTNESNCIIGVLSKTQNIWQAIAKTHLKFIGLNKLRASRFKPKPSNQAVQRQDRYYQNLVTQAADATDLRCMNCGCFGHSKRSCKASGVLCKFCGQRGHFQSECQNIECQRCKTFGHKRDKCPNQEELEGYYCLICGGQEHDAKDCTLQTSIAHERIVCVVCREEGHEICGETAQDSDDGNDRVYCPNCSKDHLVHQCDIPTYDTIIKFSDREFMKLDPKVYGHVRKHAPDRWGYKQRPKSAHIRHDRELEVQNRRASDEFETQKSKRRKEDSPPSLPHVLPPKHFSHSNPNSTSGSIGGHNSYTPLLHPNHPQNIRTHPNSLGPQSNVSAAKPFQNPYTHIPAFSPIPLMHNSNPHLHTPHLSPIPLGHNSNPRPLILPIPPMLNSNSRPCTPRISPIPFTFNSNRQPRTPYIRTPALNMHTYNTHNPAPPTLIRHPRRNPNSVPTNESTHPSQFGIEDGEVEVLAGESPNESGDWRAERRKKFPTAANIRVTSKVHHSNPITSPSSQGKTKSSHRKQGESSNGLQDSPLEGPPNPSPNPSPNPNRSRKVRRNLSDELFDVSDHESYIKKQRRKSHSDSNPNPIRGVMLVDDEYSEELRAINKARRDRRLLRQHDDDEDPEDDQLQGEHKRSKKKKKKRKKSGD